MADKEQLPVQVSVMEKEGRWFGVVPMAWLEKAAPPSPGHSVEGLLASLAQKVPLMQQGVDKKTGEPCAVIGPCPDAAAAEAFARAFVAMVAEALDMDQAEGDPVIRASADGKGLMSDFQQESATDPKKLGGPPPDWDDRVTKAHYIHDYTKNVMGADTMALMTAAMLSFREEKKSSIAFIMLARAVRQWLDQEEHPQSPLEAMEARARAIAQLVANNIDPSEDFVLLLCNGGATGGAMTHIGSLRRDVMISLVEEWMANVKQGQPGD